MASMPTLVGAASAKPATATPAQEPPPAVSPATAAPIANAQTAPTGLERFTKHAQTPLAFRVDAPGRGAPYLAFAHPLGRDWAALCSQFPGIAEPQPYLKNPDNSYKKLDGPIKFYACTGFRYFADVDVSTGEVKRASYTADDDKLKEAIDAPILLVYGDKIIPAHAQFRTTKTPAIRAALATLEACQTAEWLGASPAHAAVARIPQPAFRFITEVSFRKRTARGSGYNYHQADGSTRPVALAEIDQLRAYLETPAGDKELNAVLADYERSKAFIEKIIAGKPRA